LFGFRNNGQPHEDFDTLYVRHYDRLYRVVYSLVRDKNTTLDILQEAYVKSFLKYDQLRDKNKFGAWLTKVAVNEAKTTLVRAGRHKLLPLDDSLPTPNYRDAYDELDLKDLVTEALRNVTADDKAVLILKYYCELSTGEIAQALRISQEAVRVKLHRARSRLRKVVEADIDFQSGVGRASDDQVL